MRPFDPAASTHREKLALLYALTQLSPCTRDQLQRFMTETGAMEPFTALVETGALIEDGFLSEQECLEGVLLRINAPGEEVLRLFGEDILASVQEKIDGEGPAWRRRFAMELQLPAQCTKDGDGYETLARFLDEGTVLLECRLRGPEDLCRRMAALWPKSGAELYSCLTALPETPLPVRARLRAEVQHPDTGRVALLSLEEEEVSLLLQLPMPDEQQGRLFIRRWQESGGAFWNLLLQKLHS